MLNPMSSFGIICFSTEDMAILLVLLSGFILIHQMAEGKLVCIGEKEKLSCPAPKAEWKVKQLESGLSVVLVMLYLAGVKLILAYVLSDLHFPLVEWRSGRLFVMHNIPPSFQGRVLALSDGTLTISDFQVSLISDAIGVNKNKYLSL